MSLLQLSCCSGQLNASVSSASSRALAEILHVIPDRCTAFMANVGVGPVVFKIVKLLLPFPITTALRHTESSLLSTGFGAAADNCAADFMQLLPSYQGAVGPLELSSILAVCPAPKSPHVDGVPQIEPRVEPYALATHYISAAVQWLAIAILS